MDLVTDKTFKPPEQDETRSPRGSQSPKSLAADAEPVWHYTQPGFCHEADAQLAWTYIALDEPKKSFPYTNELTDEKSRLGRRIQRHPPKYSPRETPSSHQAR